MPYEEVPESQFESIKRSAKEAVQDLPKASVRYAKSLFPIVHWMPRYNLQWFIGDFIAGFTIALILFPQAISYATKLAGLPAEYGLYTGFVGCLLYSVFATSKDVTIGLTAVLALVLGQSINSNLGSKATTAEKVTFGITMSFWVGIIQLFIGLFRLGVVVDFVPIPVIAGFTSGACIQIQIQQLPGLFGVKGINTNENPPYQILYDFLSSVGTGASKYDAIFGVTALFFLFSIKYIFQHLAKTRPVLRFVGYMRNAIVLIVYIGVSYAFRDRKDMPFSIVKTIPKGLSGIRGPDLSGSFTSKILPAVPSIFIISLLEHIAVVKMYGRQNGYTVNPNQETIALGLTNVIGSFIGALPSTGSFSRSAIKSSSGVRTPFGTFYTGVLVIIGLFTITDVLYYIPSAVLSAIVMAAIFELFVNFKILKNVFEVEILDGLGFMIALVVCFVSTIENSLYASVGWSVLVLLARIARPKIKVLNRNQAGHWVDPLLERSKAVEALHQGPEGILVFKIEESLTYPNSGFFAERLKETILTKFKYTGTHKAASDKMWSDDTQERALAREKLGLETLPPLRAVVLDFSSVNYVDYTGLQALLDSKDDLARFAGKAVQFHFVNVHRGYLSTVLRVPGVATGASIDATPSAPAHQGKAFASLAKHFKTNTAVDVKSLSDRLADNLQYFHYTIDDAVAAADAESQPQVEQITINSHAETSAGYLVATSKE
ncbi:sulfate transporter family-domain-containing protein [Obelidium mucronatum]|nr:sulfate transporter family-domain-containing protein [Obelidium mucronatum]